MGGSQSFPIEKFSRDHVVIVTGGNTGIGYETAKWIAMMGAKVIIACRSEERALEAIDRMNREYQEERGKGRSDLVDYDRLCVEYMNVDLASLRSTKQFIDAFLATGQPLHVLICNAGIAMAPQNYTEDENELHFQVNYLSHFLITAYLLPVMKTSGDDCRIINVSSAGERVGSFNMETIQGRDVSNFGRFHYYGRSKLYQLMQMYSMARRLKGGNVAVCSVHPGVVDTEIQKYSTDLCWVRCLVCVYKGCGIARSPFEGALASINAAVNPKLRGHTGVYYVDTKPATPSRNARNKEYQEQLWKYTLECLKDWLTDDVINSLEGNL